MSSAILLPAKAVANGAPDPNISGGADISGAQGAYIPVSPGTPIQVTSSSDPVTAQVGTASGELSMTTTTGLTFSGPDTGSFIKFSGSVSDVNAALATLRYRSLSTGTFTISAQVVGAGENYNPGTGSYYQVVSGSVTWNEAMTNAASLTYKGANGHLVAINSQQENDYIKNQINTYSWIAATDIAKEGDWRWTAGPQSGALFWTGGAKGNGGHAVGGLYNNWNGGEPNDSEGIEDCGSIYSDSGVWNDTDCAGTIGDYIAEFEGATPPPSVSLQASITTEPPVAVSDCDQLENIASNPSTYWFKDITLTDNIDCSGHNPMTALFGDSGHPYHGTFDGGGFTISNVNITGGSNVGLFAYVNSATIKNVNLVDATITGSQCVGTLVGRAYNANIENNTSSGNVVANNNWNWGYGGIVGCYELNTDDLSYALRSNTFSGSISADGGVNYFTETGGIVGYLYTYGSSTVNVDDNTFSGNIGSSYYYVGGVAGHADIEENTIVTMSGNLNSGSINGSLYEVGGFVGYSETNGTASFVLDNNTFDAAAKIVNAAEYVGGVAGYMYASDNAHIQANNNNINGIVGGAEDEGRFTDDSIGGLVGYVECYTNYAEDGNCVFNNNTSDASIFANYSYAGGMIGYLYNYGNTRINNNLNTGEISADYDNYGGYLGGMVGYLYSYNYDSDVNVATTLQNNTNNGQVDGSYYSGGIIGYGYIENDYSNSTMSVNMINNTVNGITNTDYDDAGGLAGYMELYTYYNNSPININANSNTVNGEIQGYQYLGGAFGDIYSYDYSNSKMISLNVISSIINGNISTNNGGRVGGIMGNLEYYYSKTNINNNEVNSNISTEDPSVSSFMGGLIGYLSGDHSNANILSNIASSTITGGNNYTGGLLGYIEIFHMSEFTLQDNVNSASISGGAYTGGLIGQIGTYSSKSTIRQNLNEGSVNATGDRVGGLIGYAEVDDVSSAGISIISQNINRGPVYSKAYDVGGLIGRVYGYASQYGSTIDILDSYNSGSVAADDSSSNDLNVGGLIGFSQLENYAPEGNYTALNIQSSYNSGAVHAYYQNAGGLIGYSNELNNSQALTNISNSFATGSVSSGNQAGGIVGFMPGSGYEVPVGNGVYFDQTATGQSSCNSSDQDPAELLSDCNAVNTDGSQPNYFKNNTTNAPLNTWNFVNTWGTQTFINDGLPCLQWENPLCNPAGDNDGDGISNAVENAGPNNGDANNDGIPDYRQGNVTTLVDVVSGKYSVVQSSCNQNDDVFSQAESIANQDKAFDYPVGLTGFTTTCASEGDTASITYFVYGSFDPSQITVRKYNPTTGIYTTVTGATITSITIGGQPVLKVEYTVTDGSEFDLDGSANGVIVDPVGIASAATIAPNTGFERK